MTPRPDLALPLALLLCACASGTSPAARPVTEPPAARDDGSPPPAGTAAPPDAPAARGEGGALPAGMQEMLEAHNQARAEHCASPLAWSEELAKEAQKWADALSARGCAFEHSKTSHGENLMAGTAGAFGPKDAVGAWYAEKKSYSFGAGVFSMRSGHFTQLVWAATKRVGCGTTTCQSKQIWVCNYDPPGNVQGDFKQNVLPTSCRK